MSIPKKWAVRRTRATAEKINEYFNTLGATSTYCWKPYDDISDFLHSEHVNEGDFFPHAVGGYTIVTGFTEIPFEDFMKYIVNKEPEFDENDWNIHVDTKEQFDEVLQYFINKGDARLNTSTHLITTNCRFLSWNEHRGDYHHIDEGFPQFSKEKRITWEQFQQLKTKQMATKATKTTKTTGTEGTVIGYKCPMDLGGYSTKGETFLLTERYAENSFYRHNTVSTVYGGNASITLPKEVVEAWKAVYEELFKEGDWVVVLPEDDCYHNAEQGIAQKINKLTGSSVFPYELRFSNGSRNTYKKVRKATPAEIKAAEIKAAEKATISIGSPEKITLAIKNDGVYNPTSNLLIASIETLSALYKVMRFQNQIGNYEVTFPQVKLGCTTFTFGELCSTIDKIKALQ